ncbi:LysR family transcriptional regulator [Kocuria sp. U4B]
MDLTVHHLRCFLAVAEELHFGRAAARLHLSPSSLSEQVSGLERRLSRSLFRRSSRRVELTEAGRLLLPLAQEAVAAMDTVLAWATGPRA